MRSHINTTPSPKTARLPLWLNHTGFAPDVDINGIELAELYDHVGNDAAEETVFVSWMPSDSGGGVLSLGWFEYGFMDVWQLRLEEEAPVLPAVVRDRLAAAKTVVMQSGQTMSQVQAFAPSAYDAVLFGNLHIVVLDGAIKENEIGVQWETRVAPSGSDTPTRIYAYQLAQTDLQVVVALHIKRVSR